MAFNPAMLMRMKERTKLFQEDHPRVGPFFSMLKSTAVVEGAVYELKVTTPDGREHVANIRLTANDVETIHMLSR